MYSITATSLGVNTSVVAITDEFVYSLTFQYTRVLEVVKTFGALKLNYSINS